MYKSPLYNFDILWIIKVLEISNFQTLYRKYI